MDDLILSYIKTKNTVHLVSISVDSIGNTPNYIVISLVDDIILTFDRIVVSVVYVVLILSVIVLFGLVVLHELLLVFF